MRTLTLITLSCLAFIFSSLMAQEEVVDENGIILMAGIDHLRPRNGTYYNNGALFGIGTDSKQTFTAFQFRLCYQTLPLNKSELIAAFKKSGLVSQNATSIKVTGGGHRYITGLVGTRIFYPTWIGIFQPYISAHVGIYRWFGETMKISGDNGNGLFSGTLKSNGNTNLSYRLGIGSELRLLKLKLFVEGGYFVVSARGQDPEFTPLLIGLKF